MIRSNSVRHLERRGRLIGVAAAVTIGLGLFSPGAANADTFIPLSGGAVNRTLGDGTVVHLRITDESARISPSMGSTPLHRNVWTSGRTIVDVTGPGAASAGIQMNPGYVVGCQVSVGGATTGEQDSETVTPGSTTPLGVPSIGTTETLVVTPGQAVARYLLDIEQPDDYGQEQHKTHPTVNGPHASVSWQDETFSVDGCGGYAQARAFTYVDVSTSAGESITTVWGQPFSMG